MQFSTIAISAFAALAAAAPTQNEPRGQIDRAQINNFGFNSVDFAYLTSINSLDLNLLAQLGQVNNFNIGGFQNLFQNNVFDVATLLQLQQVQTLVQLQQVGLFNGFDLSTLNLGVLNLGLINNVGGFNLGSLIDASLVPQIQTIAQQTIAVVV